ncbi:MAG: type IV toxin-antitoxin system AbiEi family antitoxin domain-containing protein [candidate division WOR-3 bacterium]|nr:type IV toxin-antitoxin system AbiEi family antitoxin domain-containing protein [candidate division WOR-3 bacterium]
MRINLLERLAKKGNVFTFDELLRLSNIQRDVLWVILSRLERKGWIERIEKGKYMIIPLGAEKGKYTLNEFVIGSMLIKPYCIAYWSALNFYGLTEQIPNVVFIQSIARKKKQEKEIFGVRYRVVRVRDYKFFGIRKEWIEETQINITDMEKTIIDCLDKPQYCGGVVEVAKALKSESIDRKKLADYAGQIGNSGVMRRLGYLCDFLGVDIDIPLSKTRNYLLLDPTMPQKGLKNAKWRLVINLNEKILGKLE